MLKPRTRVAHGAITLDALEVRDLLPEAAPRVEFSLGEAPE